MNTAISKARKSSKTKLVFPERIPETTKLNRDPEPDGETHIHALYKCIDQLKPVEKAIILLHLESHIYGEIADVVGISKQNVSVKLVRIRRKLKELIEPLITTNV